MTIETIDTVDEATAAWAEVHDAYLETHLDRLRLLARRRVGWLRGVRWRTDPIDADSRELRVDRLLSAAAADITQAQEQEVPHVDEALGAHDRRLAELEAELISLGGPAALTVLEHAAGLSPVEREAVVIALAPELDHTFRGLYAYLHDDPALRQATPGLVAALTGRPLPQTWDLLHPDTPSRAFRVFASTGEASGVTQTLRLDARMVGFLRGVNRLDDRLRGVVTVLPDLPLASPHRALADRLADWMAAPDRVAEQRMVTLVGAPGQGREAVASGLARRLGLVGLRLRADLVAGPDRAEIRRLLDRETILLPAALYVDAPGQSLNGTPADAVWRGIDDLCGPVMIGSRTPAGGATAAPAVDVPALTGPDRVQLWAGALKASTVTEEDLARLVEQFPLGPEHIARAADDARARAELRVGAAASPRRTDVWAAARNAVGGELSDLAVRLEPSSGWNDLVLPDREHDLLRAIAAQVAARSLVYGEWGLGTRLRRGRGITALFAGPSGTGKTMAAEVIAGHLDLHLHRIDLASVISKYIGETEKNLRRVFDAAEQGGAVLFFDEADALFGKRTEVRDSHDRYANVEINYLLQRMEDYAGLAILATNRKSDLDPAFLRRIRFVVTFPFPDADLRRRIWQRAWPEATPTSELDWHALARLEVAGGNIRTIAVNAAFLAAAEQRSITMDDALRAARYEYDKLDRRPNRTEFGDLVGKADR